MKYYLIVTWQVLKLLPSSLFRLLVLFVFCREAVRQDVFQPHQQFLLMLAAGLLSAAFVGWKASAAGAAYRIKREVSLHTSAVSQVETAEMQSVREVQPSPAAQQH